MDNSETFQNLDGGTNTDPNSLSDPDCTAGNRLYDLTAQLRRLLETLDEFMVKNQE